MEEKDSEISGPCEEFRIWFCGEVPSRSVAWYCIDVSEKTENSTKKLNPFSEYNHFPSVYHAFLKGRIYSLGGQERDKTLLNVVWILDTKFLYSLAARGEEEFEARMLKRLKPKEPEKPQERREIRFSVLKSPLMPKEPEKPQERREIRFSVLKSPLMPKEPEKPQERLKLKEPEFEKPKRLKRLKLKEPEPEEPQEPELSFYPAAEILSKPLPFPAMVDLRLLWNCGRSMTFARCNPHTMVVDQKLYVLGGFESNQNLTHGWVEVFDPVEGQWITLPSPPDQIHSSVMISGLLEAKKEIIIAKQRWDRDPMKFYFYNIMTRSWSEPLEREAKVHLPPNSGRAVTVGNTLYWISTEEHNHECIIRAYDLDRNMWFEDHLNTATIFGRREHFSSIYSSRPGFLHLHDQKFCLLLQSSITKNFPESSIEYLYCVILDISPIYEHEDSGKFELTTVSVQKYSMDRYIKFLDCMLGDRVSGVKSVDRRGQSTSADFSLEEIEEFIHDPFKENDQV